MPVELRKRKAPEPAPAPAPKKNGAAKSKATKVVEKVKEAVTGKPAAEPSSKTEGPPPATSAPLTTAKADAARNAAAKTGEKPAVGDVVDLNDFGGEVTTHDGKPTTLKKLVEDSAAGVVLFTYPKASTPGCTTQACLFRDAYTPLTSTGLSIYGLSTDSPKSNTTFKTKQNLPYPLLCDPEGNLIKAIGLRKPGGGKSTQRGVFIIGKDGKVLAAEPGGPAATVDVVKRIVGGGDLESKKSTKVGGADGEITGGEDAKL